MNKQKGLFYFLVLRISNIQKLTFDKINNGYIDFRQKKTRGLVRLILNERAFSIYEQQKKEIDNNKVFSVLSDKHSLNT